MAEPPPVCLCPPRQAALEQRSGGCPSAGAAPQPEQAPAAGQQPGPASPPLHGLHHPQGWR